MEFYENKAKTPFIRLVQLWQAVRRWRRQMQTRRVLQQMSDEGYWVTQGGCGVRGKIPLPVWGRGEKLSVAFCY